MPQTGGYIRSIVSTTVRGVYDPPGIPDDDNPADIKRFANIEIETLRYGSGEGFIDREVCVSKAIPAGSSATYDLYTGTDLPGMQDEAAPFRTIKFLQVGVASGGDSSGVRIGGAASDEWVGFFVAAGDKQDIFPGGPPYLAGSPVGVSVTSSAKNLKIENRGASEVVVRIVIGGSVVVPGMWTGFFGILTYA